MSEKYGKTEIGPSDVFRNPKPKRGWSVWIESGVWFTAPTVNPRKFGRHDWENGMWEKGVRNCRCGCYMGSYSSAGPVDPSGACPAKPRKTGLARKGAT